MKYERIVCFNLFSSISLVVTEDSGCEIEQIVDLRSKLEQNFSAFLKIVSEFRKEAHSAMSSK